MNTWDMRFLSDAKHHSSHSKDPSRRVGAVFVRDNNILSIGWNGFPRGIADTPERLNHRETKYKYVVHAEMNGIYNATHNGVSLNGSTVYVHGLPICSHCALGLIQVGIVRAVMVVEDMPERWKESFALTRELFNEAGIGCETNYVSRPVELDHNIKETLEKLSKSAL